LPQFNLAILKNFNKKTALELAEKNLYFLEKNASTIYGFHDEAYPNRLKSIEDAPLLLYGKGNLQMNGSKTIAVVGTRNMTHYGRKICEELIDGIKELDITVISGLALGVDGEAHKNCLKHQLPTIGVLAHGLDRIYPREHQSLAEAMMEKGGILTEFLPHTLPDREHFPMRNRIVAGMADAVVVVESGEKGGSLITCELANDYQKEVFAYPGNVTAEFSKGCHKIIAQNKANLICSSKDVLRYMSWGKTNGKQTSLPLMDALNEIQINLLAIIKSKESISFDSLMVLSEFSVGELNNVLLQLELLGYISSLPAKRYKVNWEKLRA
jgi:DNA processing protein